MERHIERLAERERLAAEVHWTGQAVGTVGAAVAVLSSASAADPSIPLAGLALTVSGALTALLAEWRLGVIRLDIPRQRARSASSSKASFEGLRSQPRPVAVGSRKEAVLVQPGRGVGRPGLPGVERAAPLDPKTRIALWDLGLQFDRRRALRCVMASAPASEMEAMTEASVLLPVTVLHTGSDRTAERFLLCMPEMLVLLREADLGSAGFPSTLPTMVSAREYQSCAFWLPEERGRPRLSRAVAYAESPDGDIYMRLDAGTGGTVRVRFRYTRWPEGPVRERLWEEFDRLATLVDSALEKGR